MSFRSALVCCLLVALMSVTVMGATKSPATPLPALAKVIKPMQAGTSLTAAAACTTSSVNEIIYRMDGWVTGNELYKAYIDPSAQCSNPYPYTVTAVSMPMYFATATQLSVAVDIEDVQGGTCASPGDMRGMSADYTFTIPGLGYYSLWVPLDAPVSVTGPFFAGFFIGSTLDASAGAAVLIDSFPTSCRSYNVWDTAIGFVDLTNFPAQFGSDWNWPGNLAMDVAGIPGGNGGTPPVPQVALLSPVSASKQFGSTELWAWEKSGSSIIDYVTFEYNTGLGWQQIGRDYDGTHSLRNGVDSTEPGNGYSVLWDFSSLAEKMYSVRAMAVDTLGRADTATILVYLEPTPPVARIVSPSNGAGFCTPLSLLMQCGDENLQDVEVFDKAASAAYSCGLTTLSQQALGDTNGNPADGNHASGGEYGDYYSGPAAAAIAIKLWNDRGFSSLMQGGGGTMTLAQVAEELAADIDTRKNHGTFDENLYGGLLAYNTAHGGNLGFSYDRVPDYWQIRAWAEEEERAVLLGLGGSPGLWVTVDGFSGWEQQDGSYLISISNPTTGSIQTVSYRPGSPANELYVNGSWHSIDIAISLVAKAWQPARTLIGTDTSGNDGWSLVWAPSGLDEDGFYFFRAVGNDSTLFQGTTTVLLHYNCAGVFSAGDYDGDGHTDLNDLMRLVGYLTKTGPAPLGGVGRADANCDNTVNLADIIYYMNFLFGQANSPCY